MKFALALLLAASAASAQAVRIKLGTLAPQGSTWHQFMQQMAADFAGIRASLPLPVRWDARLWKRP